MSTARTGDHPRLRGEQAADKVKQLLEKGSPPLARGTVVVVLPMRIKSGITPACAGNRMLKNQVRQILRDHPRLRGEQFRLFTPAMVYKGSPPLARGTGGMGIVRTDLSGITPACAGNSK